ncbi:unnamed protein product [Amoebophrya sp. A25]|nr:unnamed protein product [Amoebophrya sp. A25]|eukprot:GSA25T00020464001.1
MRLDVEKKPDTYRHRQYRVVELPNKLRLVLISDPNADKASIAVSVKVGSLCEKPYKTDGLAHFLEHMLFLGTKKYPEEESYKKFLTKNGGGCNASTSDDWTRYHLYVAPPHLEEAVDRISQFFLHPLLDADCTDREMHAVDSEHKKNLQNEARRALQVFRIEADQTHPLNHFRTGSLETLKKDDIRDVLLSFHQDFYSANLMGVAVLGRESLDELEAMLTTKSRFEDVVNKDVSLPEMPFAFGSTYAVNRIAPKLSDGTTTESSPAKNSGRVDQIAKHVNSGPLMSLPVEVGIEPVKEERYFAFQFFTPEQEKFWREKTDGFWGHVLGYEGPGSLLSYLKNEGLATGLSAGMYYDGGGTGLFQVRIALTKEKGVASLERIGDLFFNYLVMLRKDLIEEYHRRSGGSSDGSESILARIWRERKDLAELRFRYRGVADPVDSVLSASRNVLLYPPEELLAGGTLVYEPMNAVRILEFFDFFRLDNLRLVRFHRGSTTTPLVREQVEQPPVLEEQHFGVKYRKPQPLPETLLQRWKKKDDVLERYRMSTTTSGTSTTGTSAGTTSGRDSAMLKSMTAELEIPSEFFVMRRNDFVPTNFDLVPAQESIGFRAPSTGSSAAVEPFWPVPPYHDDEALLPTFEKLQVQGGHHNTEGATEFAKWKEDLSMLYRVPPGQEEVSKESESTATSTGGYRLFFKETLYPYEEPRLYAKVNIYSDFVAQDLDTYCRTLFFVQTVLERLNEEFYDSEISGLDYDIVTHAFGGLTLFVGGYSDKLVTLFEQLVKRFVQVLPEALGEAAAGEVETSSNGGSSDYSKLAAALEVLKERKRKNWYNSAFKKQPLEVAGEMVDEAISANDYPMKDMYNWLLAKQDSLTVESLRETQSALFEKTAAIGEGLVEGNLRTQDVTRISQVLKTYLPLGNPLSKSRNKEQGVVESAASQAELPGFRKGVRTIQKESRIVTASPNPNDPNSATVLYLQTGAYCRQKNLVHHQRASIRSARFSSSATEERDSFFEVEDERKLVKTRVLNMLLCQMLGQPFFADLRTKQQLGYLVSARADFVNGMTGLAFRVQSSNTKCHDLEQKIATFFENFEKDILLQKTTAEFEEFKRGVVSKLQERPKKLAQEFARNWAEISFRSFNFGWRQVAIALLADIKFDEFLSYYRAEVMGKAKLWVHVLGPDEVGTQKVLNETDHDLLGKTELHLSEEYEQLVNNLLHSQYE